MYCDDLLRNLRNNLPLSYTLKQLGNEAPVSKHIEGYLRFQCLSCNELRATINPRNNLAHCFTCNTNFNNIDLMIKLGYDFIFAVETLKKWLVMYREKSCKKLKISDQKSSNNNEISSLHI